MSAIKELLGKEAHELTDEELADLLRGNRPKAIEPKIKKSKTISGLEDLDIDLGDLGFDDDDFLGSLSLDDAEEK